MKKGDKKGTSRKAIYNCHIHTFTFANTPFLFPVLFILDSDTGRLSLKKILISLIALSLTCLVLLSAVPVLQNVLFQLDQFLQTPLSQTLRSFLSYLIQPPSIAFLPQSQYSVWVSWALLVLKDSIIVLLIITILQVIVKWLKNIWNWFWRLWRSRNDQDELSVEISNLQRNVAKTIRSNPIFSFLTHINPVPNDIFERYARFLNTALLGSQLNVFREVQDQYPEGTKFIVLPMNMEHMGWQLGPVFKKIENQHEELLCITKEINGETEEEKIIYPFYTVHPKQKNIDQVIKEMNDGRVFGPDKFRGLKIYPNLGYYPNDAKLMEIYNICQREDINVPVIAHCTPRGIWKFGLSDKNRRDYGRPENYREILTTYPNLRLCLAHFGGAVEWIKHLRGRFQTDENEEATWVRTIYEMIDNDKGEYSNLYTDISYTAFTPKVLGLYIDLVDYLKVLLSHLVVRERVLFGSDYYMVEQEKISEKELAILLRSRLGEDLYTQIAHTNPRRFLGIASTNPKRKNESGDNSLAQLHGKR